LRGKGKKGRKKAVSFFYQQRRGEEDEKKKVENDFNPFLQCNGRKKGDQGGKRKHHDHFPYPR